VKAFMANQRQGNASTKIRKYVVGGNQKPWKQKGTGRARQGSTRAPHWVGGGTTFGPRPRKYTEVVPRQVRALARKSALNARAREGALLVIDALQYDAPRTSRLQQLLARLDLAHRKVLILTDGVKPNVFLSGRNIQSVHVLPYSDVSTYHVLWAEVVLVEAGALGYDLKPLAEKELPKVKVRRFVSRGGAGESGAEASDESDAEAEGKATKKKSAKAGRTTTAAKKAPAKKKVAAKRAAPKAAAKAPTAAKAGKKPAARKTAPKKRGK
jgi:large subunit ribosomal protein L4